MAEQLVSIPSQCNTLPTASHTLPPSPRRKEMVADRSVYVISVD